MFRNQYPDRTQQTGVKQWRITGKKVKTENFVRLSPSFLLWQTKVSDDPVGPDIDDIHLKNIPQRLDNISDLHTPGSSPQDP